MTPTRNHAARAWGRRQWMHVVACVAGFAIVAACTWVVVGPQLGAKPSVPPHGMWLWLTTRVHQARSTSTGYPGGAANGFFSSAAPVISSPLLSSGAWDPRVLGRRKIASTPDGYRDVQSHYPDEVGAPPWEPPKGWTVYSVTGTVSRGVIRGVWARTGKKVAFATSVQPVEPKAPIGNYAELVRIFWEEMARQHRVSPSVAVTTLVATGMWSGWRTMWFGYAINTATVVGLAVWLWFTPVVMFNVWRWRRLRRGGCKACGYDVRGLGEGVAVCPECGSALVRDAGEASLAPP